jgi:hypothetical protein
MPARRIRIITNKPSNRLVHESKLYDSDTEFNNLATAALFAPSSQFRVIPYIKPDVDMYVIHFGIFIVISSGQKLAEEWLSEVG